MSNRGAFRLTREPAELISMARELGFTAYHSCPELHENGELWSWVYIEPPDDAAFPEERTISEEET